MKFVLFIAMLIAAPAAKAADEVALDSKVFVEREIAAPDGKSRVVREDPKMVVPGEKLLFVLNYMNLGAAPAGSFVVTNPIPDSVAYLASDSPGAVQSVDGGKSWGPLATLKVKDADGTLRPATASDVTHIRWIFAKPIPVGGKGSLNFKGVVR